MSGRAGHVPLLADGLAPWAARDAGSRGRPHPEEEHAYRTSYQRDRDRMVHSTAFRRLEYKTQVFVNHEGDHYRTRLTHTLEVAQIARTAARALGLNEDLVEAVALSHDIGHTPFGHAGEETLDRLMAGEGGFEHNRHGLRVVDRIERRYADFEGLNLTYEVREAFVRHRTRYDLPGPGGAEFPEDEEVHLEGQVVSLADSIAYNSHDLDDGLMSGLLSEADVQGVAVWDEAAREVSADYLDATPQLRARAAVRRIIDRQVTDLIESSRAAIAESGARTLEDVRHQGRWLVGFGPELESERQELQSLLAERLYAHARVRREVDRGRECVRALHGRFMRDPAGLPPDFLKRVEEEGTARVVCDYIAGMTDRYARDACGRLCGPRG